jgi:hypothetical protein
MQDKREYTVYPSNLDIPSSFKCYRDYLKNRGYSKGAIYTAELTVSRYRTLSTEDFIEFIELLNRHPHSLIVNLHTRWEKEPDYQFTNQIYLTKSSHIDIVSSVHDKLQQCFHASNPHQDQIDRLSKFWLKKSVFLAHKFDEIGNKLASTLERFLLSLGFDVKEGSGYEPKNIPDKVARKIDCQDIFICLVTPGDSSWILSEAAYAKGRNKYLIIICQDSVEFNKGIIGGDYEHLSFPNDFIEKCFSDLVYALPI